jgi:hypothetical protein
VHALHQGDALKDVEGITNVSRLVHRMIDMIHLLNEHRRLTGSSTVLAVSEQNERVGLPLNVARESA